MAGKYKLEKDIQKSILDFLNLLELQWTITDAARVYGFTPDGEKILAAHSKTRKSWPDITVCLPVSIVGVVIGAMWTIEVKRPGGKFQPGQENQLEMLADNGAYVLTARSLDDVIFFLNSDSVYHSFLAAVHELAPSRLNRVRQLLRLPAER